ncbi:PAS domain S-box protein [Magnetovibrio sp.]|uniref:PAS domain S-box protein n=1 Tax=Magnetovibrio sp. TaxID=2024836 RepID=UPI002F92B900
MGFKALPLVVLAAMMAIIAAPRGIEAHEIPTTSNTDHREANTRAAGRPIVNDPVVAAVPKYFPPYYDTNRQGAPTGFAIEIMEAIAQRAGLKIEYKVYDTWPEVQDAVKTGQAQIIPNMGITPDREDFLNFTAAFEQFHISFFVPWDRYDFFANGVAEGSRIATALSNAASKILTEQGGYDVRLFDDTTAAVNALLTSKVDALALPEPVVFEHMQLHNMPGALIPVGEPLAVVTRALAVAKGQDKIFERLKSATEVFLDSKEYEDIYRTWHGGKVDPWTVRDLVVISIGLIIVAIITIWLWYFVRSRFIPKGSMEDVLRSTTTDQLLRRRIMLMSAVMVGGLVTATLSTLYLHYRATMGQVTQSLHETIASQVSMIESFAQLPLSPGVDVKSTDMRNAVISRLSLAKSRHAGLSEITIGEKSGDEIHFILRQRDWDRFSPMYVPLASDIAVPMRLALSGQRGTVVGLDYRNERVLAAYEYIDTLGLGVVLKIDIADLQAPHIKMAIYGSFLSFAIAMLIMFIYMRVTLPVIREIQLKEAQYDGFRDNAQAIMFLTDLDGKATEVNKAYCDIFGETREQVMQSLHERSLSADEVERFQQQNRTIVETGTALDIEESLTINGVERAFLTKKFPLETPNGEIYAIGGISIDVTDFRNAERALIASEERFRSTFEQAAVGLAHIGLDGRWLRVNKVLCDITGYSRDELLHLTFQDITHPDDLPLNLSYLDQLRNGDIATYRMDKRYIRKNGAETWVHVTGTLVRGGYDDPDYFIGVIEDINERIADRNEIARQRDRVRTYLDLAGTMVVALNTDGNIILINKYACHLLGYEEEQLMGKNWFDIAIAPDDRAEIRGVADKILHGDLDEVGYFENEIITHSGERRLVAWNNTYLHEPDGSILTMLSSGIDITNQRQSLLNMERSNRALHTISHCNEVLVHATSEDQLLQNICRVIVEEGGYQTAWTAFVRFDDGKHLVPRAAYGLHKDVIEEVIEDVDALDLSATSSPMHFSSTQGNPHLPNWHKLRARLGISSMYLWPLKDAGVTFGFLFLTHKEARDLHETERNLLDELANDLAYGLISLRMKRERIYTMEKLAESEERSLAIVETAHDAIIAINDSGHITQFNPAAQNMFGYTFNEALGADVSIIIPERFKAQHVQSIQNYAKTRKGHIFGKTLNLYGRRSNGQEFPIELTLSPMPKSTTDLCTAIIRDASDREEAERQRRQAQNMESLGNLAGGMAHDINNMLLPILNLTAMVKRTLTVDSSEEKKLGMVLQAAERVSGLVQRVLEFSRQDDPEYKDHDIHDIVNNALPLIKSTTPSSIELNISMSKFNGRIHADEKQINAALINLVSNASDAIGGHNGHISIELKRSKPDMGLLIRNTQLRAVPYAKLSVIDDGCGMAPEILNRAFDPFFTTKEPGKGTGLGMSMIHGIVTKHGGAIDVHSTEGKGTRVDLYLPLKQGPITKKAKSKSTSGQSS